MVIHENDEVNSNEVVGRGQTGEQRERERKGNSETEEKAL